MRQCQRSLRARPPPRRHAARDGQPPHRPDQTERDLHPLSAQHSDGAWPSPPEPHWYWAGARSGAPGVSPQTAAQRPPAPKPAPPEALRSRTRGHRTGSAGDGPSRSADRDPQAPPPPNTPCRQRQRSWQIKEEIEQKLTGGGALQQRQARGRFGLQVGRHPVGGQGQGQCRRITFTTAICT